MAVQRDSHFLSNIQSSYLWSPNEKPTDNKTNKLLQISNNNEQIQKVPTPSRLQPTIQQPQTSFSERIPTKEPTAISLSRMRISSVTPETISKPWISSSPTIENFQTTSVESQEHSTFALLAKNGRRLCQIRTCTIVFLAFLCLLCAAAIAVPIGLIYSIQITTTTTTTIITTTSMSTTSTTSTTTTTTTPPATPWIPTNYYTSCSGTCTNVTTVTPSTLIASWPFELNANDVSGNGYNGLITNGGTFASGYIGQAVSLQNSLAEYVNVSYINLASRSFTVEAWIYLNSLSTGDLFIIGQYEASVLSKHLHLTIRNNKIYMGFYSNDLAGLTSLNTSMWYHIAYIYDVVLNVKTIYLNGYIDQISTASGATPSVGPYLGLMGNTIIGGSTIVSTTNFWNGLLDQVTISNRVKTSCEILNDASLIAYFPFDGNYLDRGPNSMSGTYNPQGNNGLLWVTGRVNQSLNFNSSNSYFQSCGFFGLSRNQPYSIAMWVNPSFQSGTIFHLSSAATGSGAWCLPMIGFSLNGSIVVQTWRSGSVSIMGPILPINTWTHIVQTYSSTNGLQLYINGGLYGSAAVTTFAASGVRMCVTLGSSGLGTNCHAGLISMGPYSGAIDEFRIYNREINSGEVCPLAHP